MGRTKDMDKEYTCAEEGALTKSREGQYIDLTLDVHSVATWFEVIGRTCTSATLSAIPPLPAHQYQNGLMSVPRED